MNEHSTDRVPIIKLWRILLVPLQGGITDRASEVLKTEVLTRIHSDDVDGLIIDISALWLVDSHLCSILSHIATAAALMGTQTVMSGMKPETAITLETMGIELRGVRTTLDLEEALHLLGVRRAGDEADYGWNSGLAENESLIGSLSEVEDLA